MLLKIKYLEYNGHLVSVKFLLLLLLLIWGERGSVDFPKVVWSIW